MGSSIAPYPFPRVVEETEELFFIYYYVWLFFRNHWERQAGRN